MTDWVKARNRIEERMIKKGLNKAEVSRALGRSPGFMHDFLVGKQKRLKDDDSRQLAKLLGVKFAWILGLEASDFDSPWHPPAIPLDNNRSMSSSPPREVADAKNYIISLSMLDTLSGKCNIVYHDGQESRGKIVDPAIFLSGNQYAFALAHKTQVEVTAKKVMYDDLPEELVILDFNRDLKNMVQTQSAKNS